MQFEKLIREQRDHIVWITLNRPEALNALHSELMVELRAVIEDAGVDDDVRVVVIRGAGKAWGAGADLKEQQQMHGEKGAIRRFFTRWHGALDAIDRCPKIVIAAVHGYCFAGSMELMMSCDLAIATEEARIGDQHMNFGLPPMGSATQRLPRLVGMRRAKELLLSGDWLTGAEAERMGLVNKVVPEAEFDEAVTAFAQKFAEKNPAAASQIKLLVNNGMQADQYTGIRFEEMIALTGTAGGEKGVDAFNKKEKPVF
ncbi:MAG: enoyl-CoA hydratase/isomerase family protein [Deltaproteobacteria bacterium]|nr:enoyl-CoA hydratase/isomerase family protein [Deltaproteobacteria bacterium]